MQSNRAIVDILRKYYPHCRDIIKKGNPGQGYPTNLKHPKDEYQFNTSKAVKATGISWIRFEQTVADAAKAFEHYL
jgi:hypothetical protein